VVEVLAFGMVVEVVGPGGGVCTFSSRIKHSHSINSTEVVWTGRSFCDVRYGS